MEDSIKFPEVTPSESEAAAPALPDVPEPIPVASFSAGSRSKKSDDVLTTQCILCIVLVVSIFALYFLRPEFQSQLLEQYQEQIHAPAQAFLQTVLAKLETLFS